MASAPAAERRPVGNLESPYKGLAPYTEDDFEWFFGRDSQARIVADNLMSARITILYGGSGIGKTSLLRAGVLPMLHAEAERDRDATGRVDFAVALHNRWQADPVASLRESVGRSVADVCVSEGRPPPRVKTEQLDLALADYAQVVEGQLLLILDQFEEWFLYHQRTANGDSAGDELIRTMAAVDLPVHYLISLRDDALAQLDWFKGRVPGVFDNLLRLRHLDRKGARQAIERPLERFNRLYSDRVEIEETVVERILTDVRAGAVVVGQQGQGTIEGNGASQPEERIEAPFLQLVMTRLWDAERLAKSGTLHLETLEALGGADRIVRTYLDESMDALDSEDQSLAADIFNHLVTPSGSKIALSTSDLAQYTGGSETGLEHLLDRLAKMRILRPVAPMPGPDRTTRHEIFHDVLAASILDWRTRFLHAQTQERIAKAQARRFWRIAWAVLAGVLVLAVVGGVVITQLRASARRADAARSAAIALNTQNFTPARAVQQALQAVRLSASPTTENSLRTVVPSFLVATAVFPGPPSAAWTSFAPGDLLVTYRHPPVPGNPPGSVDVWNIGSHRRVGAPIHDVISPTIGGRLLAAIHPSASKAATGPAFLWHLGAKEPVATLGEGVKGVAISPDGRRVLTWPTKGSATLLTAKGRRISPVAVIGSALSASFAPGHRWLAVLVQSSPTSSPSIDVWDVQGRSASEYAQIVAPLGVTTVTISRKARFVLARASGGSTVLVANVNTGRTEPLQVGPSVVDSAQFSRAGDRIVTAGEDGLVRVFDSATGALLVSMPNSGGSVKQAAFSHDGAFVAGAGNDGRARIWNSTSGIPSLLLAGHAAPLTSVAFNGDDTRLATTSSNGSTRVWSVGSLPKVAIPPPAFDADMNPAHPDAVAAGSTALNAHAYLWNLGGGYRTLGPSSAGVAFSPDGRYLVTTTRVPGSKPKGLVWSTDPAASNDAPAAHHGFDLCPEANGVTPPTTIYHHPSFSPDGRYIVLATNCGAVIWRWGVRSPTRSISHTFGGTHDSIAVNAAAYSPDGRLIATGEYGQLRLWGVANTRPGQSQPQLPIPLHGPKMGLRKTPIVVVGFNRNGGYVASGDSQGGIAVWNVKSHHDVRRLTIPAIPTDVTFSPTGHRLLIAGTDGTVRVWDWESGTVLATLQLHAGATRSAEYVPGHPDEILSAGDDGIVEISKCPTCVSLPALEQLAERHLAQFGLSP